MDHHSKLLWNGKKFLAGEQYPDQQIYIPHKQYEFFFELRDSSSVDLVSFFGWTLDSREFSKKTSGISNKELLGDAGLL
ncbi:hypothetical protein CEXT_423991 [Caerostris extrusa]|uniref:Uncharacterized protein n=1 Tax=Caerostris extrusa TaxID=172846 RepID=A0AAV4XH51_CAEEX|nr:hypothetical protein CEXT_423991 [Caerostris extrusa]